MRLQLDAFQSKAFRLVQPGRIVTLAMGRGTGKTFLDRWLIHHLAWSNPGIKIGLLMPTLKQAGDVFWPDLLNDFTGALRNHVYPPNLTRLRCQYQNGSVLTTWGAENANTIRGQRFGAVLEDEADDIAPEVERAIVEPTFSKSGLSAFWVKTGTPRRGRHGTLFRDFQLGQAQSLQRAAYLKSGGNPHRYASFRCRSSDSPQVDQRWLTQVRIDLYSQGKGPVYEREYACNFDAAEGLVYPHFDERFHVKEAPAFARSQWTEILVGVDHGFQDPAVFTATGVIGSGREAVCHVFREFYARQQEPLQLREEARRWVEDFPNARWYGDPSRPDLMRMYKSVGARVVEDVDNAIEPGVSAVADRLSIRTADVGEGKVQYALLYVDPCCKNTIDEFGKYRRKRNPRNAEEYLDDIEDANNHALDTVRYALVTRFGRPPSKRSEGHQEDRQV